MAIPANDSAEALCADMLAELYMEHWGNPSASYHAFSERADALGIDPAPQIRALEDAAREANDLDMLIASEIGASCGGTFGVRVRNLVRNVLHVGTINEMAALDVDAACKSAGIKGGRTIERIRECRDAAAHTLKDRSTTHHLKVVGL